MTDIDLSAAVEAAESASLLDRRWSIAAIHVTAAAPIIAAAVREQVAREIEARLRDANSAGERFALRVAASIARGGAA